MIQIHLLKIQSEHKIANTIGLNCPQGQTPLRVQGPIIGLRIPTYQERVPRICFKILDLFIFLWTL